ncbi:uncharacterized protein LOC110029199 isoform X4 [Phalaenopsis equestris]|uniref:uncharacterized protein LOC110029199 isoform X4 n=1 Tax=Phalaenopsis equestris TaxID=78828 RepID=UPI0009E320A2|nr:uncharacterized protein LOC110029199 isoform X4 [Phalaenopsis equestris]
MNNSQCIRVRWRLRRLHRRRSSDHHPPSKTFISAFIWSDHATLNTAAPSLSGMPSLDQGIGFPAKDRKCEQRIFWRPEEDLADWAAEE